MKDLCNIVIKLMDTDSLPYLLALDGGSEGAEESPDQTFKAVITALSEELGVGEVFELPNEQVRLEPNFEFFQVSHRHHTCVDLLTTLTPSPHPNVSPHPLPPLHSPAIFAFDSFTPRVAF